ncbi:MAG: glycosyltransferase family 4 protein [Rubrivivax sp.]|nr:glycosyltransferase family 4 protein [Rubrivivax sp.]
MIQFVGPLPPPVHGFSVINRAMLERFQAAGPVQVFDRAPRPGPLPLRAAAVLGRWLRFVVALLGSPRGSGVYLGLSGGRGQLEDALYLAAARLLGRPVCVHHHSFAYLRAPAWHSRLALGLARHARHVALCPCMAEQLAAAYGIARARVAVLSNAAFLPEPAPRAPAAASAAGLHLGFLSNITTDKGIWAFFELGDALRERGVALRASVAGPVAADIAGRFAETLAARPWCRHLGPVYGEAKQAFFADIDLLVFPTFYANEAEPVTVLEALSAGVPVLANARGCLAEMVPPAAGAVLEGDARFVALAGECVTAWLAEGQAAWESRRRAAQATFAERRAQNVQRLEGLVGELCGVPA